MPIEVFSDTTRTVAHAMQHAWALDGFAELIGHGAGTGAVLPQVGVLSGFAAVLLGPASWRLRRVVAFG